MRFRKRPVEVEATRWDGTVADATRIIDWVLGGGGTARYVDEGGQPASLHIDTLEGPIHWANEGDWIIRGVAGEFYPCKPDIFAATYEPREHP